GDEVAATPQTKPPRIRHFGRNSSETTPDHRYDRAGSGSGHPGSVATCCSRNRTAQLIVTLPTNQSGCSVSAPPEYDAHLIRDRERLRPGTASLPLLLILRVYISEAENKAS